MFCKRYELVCWWNIRWFFLLASHCNKISEAAVCFSVRLAVTAGSYNIRKWKFGIASFCMYIFQSPCVNEFPIVSGE
jgi:hypothetical protein